MSDNIINVRKKLSEQLKKEALAIYADVNKVIPNPETAQAMTATIMISVDKVSMYHVSDFDTLPNQPPQKPLPATTTEKPVEKPKEETKAPPEKPTAPATATEKPPEKPYEPKGELTVGKKAEVKSGPGLDAFMGGETPKHQTFDVTPEDAAKATILPEYDRDNLHWNFCAKHPSTNIEFDNKDGTKHYQKCPECHDYLNADGKRAAYDPETGIPVKKKLPDGSQVPAKTFRKVGK